MWKIYTRMQHDKQKHTRAPLRMCGDQRNVDVEVQNATYDVLEQGLQ